MHASVDRQRPELDARILRAAAALGVVGGSTHGAQRLLALLCDPGVSAAQVAEVLAREPGLALRVLRVANSAFYGASRHVTTIERAFTLLGLDAVRGIAAAACLDRTVRRSGEAAPINLDDLVRHSLATAVAAEALARLRRPALAPDAFIAGLLHNLGVTLQLQVDPGGFHALLEALRAAPLGDLPELEAERVLVGHEHCVAVLFEAWQLPAALIEATEHHHDPLAATAGNRELAGLVHLGVQLSLASGNTYVLEPQVPARNADVMALLGVDDADLDRVAADLPERVRALREAFAAAS